MRRSSRPSTPSRKTCVMRLQSLSCPRGLNTVPAIDRSWIRRCGNKQSQRVQLKVAPGKFYNTFLFVLQEIDVEDRDYVMKKLAPVFAGVAIGGIVLVCYLLFFLVSACCKCCSTKRGCCQKPQQKQYKQRIPFVGVIAVVAILATVGGIIVLSSGPKTVGVVDVFIKDTVALVCCPDSNLLSVVI